jgi:hypothetical protein
MIKYSIRCSGFILALSISVIFGCTCAAPKPIPDPLAGWSFDFNHEPDQTIVRDYQDYIQKLSSDERTSSRVSQYLKDGKGQHAIVIEIALNGTWWKHVLIYDKDNKRVKVIKYRNGGYRS